MTKKEILSSEDWKQRKFALVLGRLTEKNDPKDLEDVEIIPLSAEKFLKLFPEDQMSLFDYYGQSSYPVLGDVNNETIGHANLKNRSERTESLKRK